MRRQLRHQTRVLRRLIVGGVFLGLVSAVLPWSPAPVSAQSSLTPWHLDRLNQRALPLDGNTDRGPLTGAGVDIYIVDSGTRADHVEFGGRAIAGIDVPSETGTSVVDPPASDCDGHGTHVAALAAGATVGVAPGARVITVRVLDCNGDGEVVEVVRALRWVRAHHRSGVAAIVNLSLGVDLGDDGSAINEEVLALINEGIVVTVAAGNGDASGRGIDACKIAPGNVERALTVAATTVADAKAGYSNFGPCIDLFAPGGDRTRAVESAWKDSATSYGLDVGTSMASPLVAGLAALLIEQQPGLCVDQIAAAIVQRATPNLVTGLDATSPNRLLFLDTSLVPAATPGRPSHVIATADRSSLVVSWDAPCNGGSPITGSTVSLLRNNKVVKRVEVAGDATAVRIGGLRDGLRYQVVVKSRNEIGDGVASVRVLSPYVRSLRVGQSVAVSALGRTDGGFRLLWSVSSSSKKICALRSGSQRLVGLRAGTCRVGLRTQTGQKAVLRNIRIAP